LTIFCIFIGIIFRNKNLIEAGIIHTARAYFNNIVLTRSWNAQYGGVFVEKKDGVASNPYLINPDITSTDGKKYTKKNPAIMTREISEIAEKNGFFQYHITSLNPLNPTNLPDQFEKISLTDFERGIRENSIREESDGKTNFRYMAPLITEKSCLECHASQGYREGDVRGGISVQFDITRIIKDIRFNTIIIIFLGTGTVFIVIFIVYILTSNLYSKLNEAQQQIKEMAIRDDLTGLYNRRYFFERMNEEIHRANRHQHLLSIMMIDIDFFKRVNDTHGHQAGDIVLREISKLLKSNSRASDIVARYGGEEFIKIIPETDCSGVIFIAEKLRDLIADHPVLLDNGKTIHLNVSIGISCSYPGQELNSESLIRLADEALYRAKDLGRNRVEISSIDHSQGNL
jgi:diguanylate cyclase (GGDEF)-like protein